MFRGNMSYDWRDKVVLITGAANGIGACLVRQVLEKGAKDTNIVCVSNVETTAPDTLILDFTKKHVAILDVDTATGVAFQNELLSKYGPGKAQFHLCDVTNDGRLFGAFQSLVENQGGVDVVVNNAAIMNDSLNMYKKAIGINVTALVTSTLKALELMRIDEGGKGGTIINISSTAGLKQSPVLPIYYATKSAVIQFSNCIGKEDNFAKTGVRVVTVCFGGTRTALFSANKIGSLDRKVQPESISRLLETKAYIQKVESAASGVVEAYKRGASGSTWLVTRDLPARDISDNVAKAYGILGEYN